MDNMDFKIVSIDNITAYLSKTTKAELSDNNKPLKIIANRMKELRNLLEEEYERLYDTKSSKKNLCV